MNKTKNAFFAAIFTIGSIGVLTATNTAEALSCVPFSQYVGVVNSVSSEEGNTIVEVEDVEYFTTSREIVVASEETNQKKLVLDVDAFSTFVTQYKGTGELPEVLGEYTVEESDEPEFFRGDIHLPKASLVSEGDVVVTFDAKQLCPGGGVVVASKTGELKEVYAPSNSTSIEFIRNSNSVTFTTDRDLITNTCESTSCEADVRVDGEVTSEGEVVSHEDVFILIQEVYLQEDEELFDWGFSSGITLFATVYDQESDVTPEIGASFVTVELHRLLAHLVELLQKLLGQ